MKWEKSTDLLAPLPSHRSGACAPAWVTVQDQTRCTAARSAITNGSLARSAA